MRNVSGSIYLYDPEPDNFHLSDPLRTGDPGDRPCRVLHIEGGRPGQLAVLLYAYPRDGDPAGWDALAAAATEMAAWLREQQAAGAPGGER